MPEYVFCWPRWPAHGTVCARCRTRGRQQDGTIKRIASLVRTYNTPFTTTYSSLHRFDGLSPSALTNKGFRVSSSLWSCAIFPGTFQPLTSRPFTEASEAGVPRYFSSRRWRRGFLGPLVPPCSRLLSKSGSGCRPGLSSRKSRTWQIDRGGGNRVFRVFDGGLQEFIKHWQVSS